MPVRRRLAPLLSPLAARTLLWGGRARASTVAQPGPVVVSSFFNEVLGIGRAGELTASALEAAGFEVIRHNLRPVLEASPYAALDLPGDPAGAWILQCNAPEAEIALARIDRAQWDRRLRIGYWAWELPKAPPGWGRTAGLFHRLWALSAFTQQSLAGFGRPVAVMPPPVPVNEARADHARFGLNAARLHVLAMADLRSTAARKNPGGTLDLFMRLYPQPQDAVVLLLKITGARHDQEALAVLRARAADRPDVRLMTEDLPAAAMEALFATADVFVSLHRAEGFGLPAAEALAAGTPALATGWSGVMTFMHGMDDLLVDHKLVPVPEGTPHYGGQAERWAEPDLADAASKLARLIGDANLRRRTGEDGRRRVAGLQAFWTRERLAEAGLATGPAG